MGKIVIVAALDATFERKPFASILELVPFAEHVRKLSAVCLACSEEAHFTYKHSHNTGEVNDIGGIDKYIPVCRGCFVKLSTETEKKLQLGGSVGSDTKSKSSNSSQDNSKDEIEQVEPFSSP